VIVILLSGVLLYLRKGDLTHEDVDHLLNSLEIALGGAGIGAALIPDKAFGGDK
jgi:hypothetical protein